MQFDFILYRNPFHLTKTISCWLFMTAENDLLNDNGVVL